MKKFWITTLIIAIIVSIFLAIFFISFPKKYRAEIDSFSKKYSLSSGLVASVINIESGYDESSLSSAGAIGIMQLMPSTALDCASRLNMDIKVSDLYDKDINLELGCFYLKYLLEIFEGNITNTLVAYNWGLGNTTSWIEKGNVDENGNVCNIPTTETKNYLKKYKVNNYVYTHIYGYK